MVRRSAIEQEDLLIYIPFFFPSILHNEIVWWGLGRERQAQWMMDGKDGSQRNKTV